ncbi:hypothetical protein DAD99_00010 [Pseudarthrobacter sp. AB1]|nr:hypothetical protein [Pseudarthrobacter sp. AB1]
MLAGILAALSVATAVVIFIGLPGKKTVALEPPKTTSSPPPASFVPQPAADAPAVAQALQGLATDPAQLMASAAKTTVSGNIRDAVPTGSKIITEESSWAPDGLGGGTIFVTIAPPNQPARQYVAVMVKENGSWKVLSTFVLGGTS